MANKTFVIPALLATAVLITWLVLIPRGDAIPKQLRSVVVSPAKPLHEFALVDHNNSPVGLERLANKWTFVFFGFTNCPDICPATLSQLSLFKRQMDKRNITSIDTQYFFVSVDPQRDGLEHLKSYVKYFEAEFVGLSGAAEKVMAFEKQLGAFHRIEEKNSSGYYSVQHSGEIFLIDDQQRLVAKFQPPIDIGEMMDQLMLLVQFEQKMNG